MTIFIVITRGFIIRNILRSGGFSLLQKKGYRVVVLLACKEIPSYLKEEFGEEVPLIPISGRGISRIHRLVSSVTSFLIYTDSTVRYLKYGNRRLIDRWRAITYFHIFFVWIISHIFFLKPLFRFFESFFPEEDEKIKKIFDEYKPDAVFSTSIISGLDIIFLNKAKRRGIPAIAMPKG